MKFAVIFFAIGLLIESCRGFSFAVSMTTIPPRFELLTETFRSWFEQVLRPTKIFVFVPIKYKRFKRKKNQYGSDILNSEYLRNVLFKNTYLKPFIANNTIEIINTDRDFGPLTKFMGILYLRKLHDYPDYWVVGDDDVGYAQIVLSKYSKALQRRSVYCRNYNNCTSYFGMTQFAETYRIQFDLNNVNPDGSIVTEPHNILHVQGVDTFVVPNNVTNLIKYDDVVRVIDYFHAKCPESFYQDDYLVSLILHVYDVKMKSIRKDDALKPVYMLEGVSKENSQMHIDRMVNHREEITKSCVVNSVQFVYSILNLDS